MTSWDGFIGPIMQHFRRQRGTRLLREFPSIGTLSIADLGGSRHFWLDSGLADIVTNVTIYNITDSDAKTLEGQAESDIPIVLFAGDRVPAGDKDYDLVMCNSVIEHVPPRQRVDFVKEMRRIGHAFVLQTPAKAFPVEPHFVVPMIHWLPRKIGYYFAFLGPWFLLGRRSVTGLRKYWWGTQLLTKKELRQLFPDCQIRHERVLGMTKSYTVVGGRLSD